MKLTTKEASKLANQASWLDPEAKKISLANGRSKMYKARRESGESSFKEYHIKSLRIGKYKQYHNYLAIYLIENKITSTELMIFSKRLNTPGLYLDDLKFKEAIERFISKANKEREGAITFNKAFELITKSLTIKKELFPNQIAPIRAREKRKARDKGNSKKRDPKGNN